MMQQITREMRQFESVFLSDISSRGATARIFTMEEELPFAGHPVLGAAAVLHRVLGPASGAGHWNLKLPRGIVSVSTKRHAGHYWCEMNQGPPHFGPCLPPDRIRPFLQRLGLDETDVAPGIEAQVVSTGLPYLIVPVRPSALAKAAIRGADLEAQLAGAGAKFILLLDVAALEMRTWDNLGAVEDVATGSAAGPAVAYLFRLGLAGVNLPVELAQGRFAGRPSKITVIRDKDGNLLVSGDVWPVATGLLDINL